MKSFIIRQTLFPQVALLALFIICFAQHSVSARLNNSVAETISLTVNDHRDGILISNPVGFVLGESLRMTVAQISSDDGQQSPSPSVRVGAWLLDSSGRMIAQSDEVKLPPNGFHSFDFDRAAINLSGEQGTGRLQVSVRLVMHVDEPYHFTDDPKATSFLVPSLEIINNGTGRTRQIYNPYITVDYVENSAGRTAEKGNSYANNLKQIGLGIHSHSEF